MTSHPDLEVRHLDPPWWSDEGWTEEQALQSALLERPIIVLMYCLHALRADVRQVFPPTVLATVAEVGGATDLVGGDSADIGGATVNMGGATSVAGGATTDVGRVGAEEEEKEEDKEEIEDENVEDNAITIDQISDWLTV